MIYIDKETFLSEQNEVITDISQVDDAFKTHMLTDNAPKRSERDYDLQSDLYTALKNGKEWLYEQTAEFQPRTAKLLLEGSELMIVRNYLGNQFFDEETAKKFNASLVQEVNGAMINIHRSFSGCNPSDEGFNPNASSLRHASLADPLRLAYFHRFQGMDIITGPRVTIHSNFLPRSLDNWDFIDFYLGDIRRKKADLSFIDEVIPDVKPKRKSDPYFNFAMFLSWWDENRHADVFFVKTHIRDGVIYYIRDHDVRGMMILENSVEAFDRYCEHILLRKEDRFDFMPYAKPLA